MKQHIRKGIVVAIIDDRFNKWFFVGEIVEFKEYWYGSSVWYNSGRFQGRHDIDIQVLDLEQIKNTDEIETYLMVYPQIKEYL